MMLANRSPRTNPPRRQRRRNAGRSTVRPRKSARRKTTRKRRTKRRIARTWRGFSPSARQKSLAVARPRSIVSHALPLLLSSFCLRSFGGALLCRLTRAADVKWLGKSYHRCSWLSEEKLTSLAPHRLRHFNRNYDAEAAEDDDRDGFKNGVKAGGVAGGGQSDRAEGAEAEGCSTW